MTTEKKAQSQQKRLMIVIVLLVWIFALRFWLLLSSAQKNLDYIANQLRAEEIIIKKPSTPINTTGTDTVMTWNSGNIQK